LLCSFVRLPPSILLFVLFLSLPTFTVRVHSYYIYTDFLRRDSKSLELELKSEPRVNLIQCDVRDKSEFDLNSLLRIKSKVSLV